MAIITLFADDEVTKLAVFSDDQGQIDQSNPPIVQWEGSFFTYFDAYSNGDTNFRQTPVVVLSPTEEQKPAEEVPPRPAKNKGRVRPNEALYGKEIG